MNDFEVVTKTKVTRERISDLLCNAFEGGSNYWVGQLKILEEGLTDSKYAHDQIAYGATVKLYDDEAETTYIIGAAQVQRGLARLAEDYTHHWIDFINENDDATTGDVFLQCIVFGEVIYG